MAAYIELPEIKGEVKEEEHDGWIAVDSISFPIFRSINEGAIGVQRSNGTTTLGDLTVVKKWDESTPKLSLDRCCPGTYMDKVTLHLCSTINNCNVVNLEIVLHHVIVTGYDFHANADLKPTPTETVSFNYTAIDMNYYKRNSDTGDEEGNIPASFDTETHRTG